MQWHRIIRCLSLWIALFLITGCDDHYSVSPTASAAAVRALQETPTQPSDDTLGSGIAVVIAAIGDSITYGDGSLIGGYPAILQDRLQNSDHNVVVRNEGIPGDQSPNTDRRFMNDVSDADFVLIMIGTNDLMLVGTAFDREPVEHIESMIDKAQARNIIPIVSTIPPQFDCRVDYNDRIWMLNNQIYAAANKQGVQVVDTHAAIIASGGAALYSDCVHFNDQGYTVLAEQFARAILEHPLIRQH